METDEKMSFAENLSSFTDQSLPQLRLLEWFGENFDGIGQSNYFSLGQLSNWSVSFIDKEIDGRILSGHGSSRDRSAATLKAICELIERKMIYQFFQSGEPIMCRGYFDDLAAEIPRSSFRNSNGWAVHFDKETVRKKALTESLERHILIASFIKNRWAGFQLVDKQEIDGRTIWSLVSRYSCMGYQAGIVVLKDPVFPGVTFGYVCDLEKNIYFSPQWEHAFFEAFNLSEKIKGRDKNFKTSNDDPIGKAIEDWLFSNWETPVFSREALPTIPLDFKSPFVHEVMVPQKICGPVPIHCAYVFGGNLIPLFFPKSLSKENQIEISHALEKNDCSLGDLNRIPIV